MNDNEPISEKLSHFMHQFHTFTARMTEDERDAVMVLILERMRAKSADDPEAMLVLDRTLALLKGESEGAASGLSSLDDPPVE